MWLGIKLTAKPKERPLPALKDMQRELGSPQAAIHYRRLFQDYPRVELGPDEDYDHHYTRLKAADQQYQNAGAKSGPGSVNPTMPSFDEQIAQAPSAKAVENFQAGKQDVALPARTPGVALNQMPPPVPSDRRPLPQRDPGQTRRPTGPTFPQQSVQDWVRSMRDKGITLDHTLQRPDAARPGNPPRGHDIWSDFISPSTPDSRNKAENMRLRDLPGDQGGFGKPTWMDRAKDMFSRRRASAEVVDFIEAMLRTADAGDDAVAAFWARHNAMTTGEDPWEFHESGSGNYYQKDIDGKTHQIVGDSHQGQPGWTHYAPGETPVFYDDIKKAVMAAHRGQMQAEFGGVVSRHPDTVPDSSYHPERLDPDHGQGSRSFGPMKPPGAKGKWQTLSSSDWEDER